MPEDPRAASLKQKAEEEAVKIAKEREEVFLNLHAMGIERVVATYYGGGDEGFVESIDLYDTTDTVQAEPVQSYGEDETDLASALQKPIWDDLGDAWYDGSPDVQGTLVWTVATKTIKLNHEWEEWTGESRILHGDS